MLEARASSCCPSSPSQTPPGKEPSTLKRGLVPASPLPGHGLCPPVKPGVALLLSGSEIKDGRRWKRNVRDLAFSLSPQAAPSGVRAQRGPEKKDGYFPFFQG